MGTARQTLSGAIPSMQSTRTAGPAEIAGRKQRIAGRPAIKINDGLKQNPAYGRALSLFFARFRFIVTSYLTFSIIEFISGTGDWSVRHLHVRNKWSPQIRFIAALWCVLLWGGSCNLSEHLDRGSHWATIIATRPRSPIAINLSPINQPLTEEALRELDSAQQNAPDSIRAACVDQFADLKRQNSVLLFAFSGGGSRAARFAAHTMELLEIEYERLRPSQRSEPFIDAIDGYSSVSGGSIYAAFIAQKYHRRGDHEQTRDHRYTAFQQANRDRAGENLTRRPGAAVGCTYFSPLRCGIDPFKMLFTNRDLIDLYASTLNDQFEATQYFGVPIGTVFDGEVTLANLTSRPVFIFNSFSQKDQTPFLITQNLLHYGPIVRRNLVDILISNPGDQRRNSVNSQGYRRSFSTVSGLLYHKTLEDINSNPGDFRLAYAAMASAAFPFVFDPVPVQEYDYRVDPSTIRPVDKDYLADGGLYDNSGVATLLNLIRQIRPENKSKPTIVLVSIISDNPVERSDASDYRANPWLTFQSPVRGLGRGVTSIDQLYGQSQRMARSMNLDMVSKIGENVHFEEIRLADYEPIEANRRSVPTDLLITENDDRLLARAAATLLRQPDKHGNSRGSSLARRILTHAIARGPRSSESSIGSTGCNARRPTRNTARHLPTSTTPPDTNPAGDP